MTPLETIAFARDVLEEGDAKKTARKLDEARNAVKALVEAAWESLGAWDGEEDSVREEHEDTITDLRAALAPFGEEA